MTANIKKVGPFMAILLILALLASFLTSIQLAQASPDLEVVCVPWRGSEDWPHPTWDGKEVTLKGTVRYPGLVSWEWDFGDGSAPATGTSSATDEYPYPVSAKHTYTGPDGAMFVATLTVTAGVETQSDTYLVRIEPKTLQVETDVAIDEGLWWLYQQQVRETRQGEESGYWERPTWPTYRVAYTGAAVQAFENNLHKPYGDPTKDPYVDCVRRGLNYLLSMAAPVDIPPEDPYGGDTNGNGIGIGCYDWETGGHPVYQVGIAMMAIVSSDTPGRVAVTGPDGVIGRTYQEIVQDMADYCAWAQNDPIPVDGSIQGIYVYDVATDTQTHISAGTKLDPDISGNKIVWADDVYDAIYVYDTTTGIETVVNYSGRSPAISGDRIVWLESGVYMYDLATNTKTPICTVAGGQSWPAISGDKIVWGDARNGNWDIYMYDLTTGMETPISIAPEHEYLPAISGNRIVWNDQNGNVYVYDLTTDMKTHIGFGAWPDISGDKIVWIDWRFGNPDIYMYDLASDTETPVCIDPDEQGFPAISGGRIVWVDMRNGNADIYMYDLTTGVETPICVEMSDQGPPAISSDRIVWHVYYGDPNRVGGWRYDPNSATSDNSVSQWPIMGLVPAEAKWGITVADFVRPRLLDWLSYSQCTEPSWQFGGFGYKWPCGWVNIAKTAGTGISGLVFSGLPVGDPRLVNAISFVDRRWNEDGEHWNNYYAMYAVMKAFSDEFLNMENTGTHNWWDEYARHLVDRQNVDGSWPQGQWSEGPLATSWAILILTRALYDIPPTAVAKANGFDETEVDKDQIVHFDGSLSRDGTYHIVLYEWDFDGDCTYDYSSSEPTAEHAYPEYVVGPIVVKLRVTDDRDVVTGGERPAMTDMDTCIVQVHPPPHPPIADANGPYLGWVGMSVTLDGSGSWDPNEPPLSEDEVISWHWDLDNDGDFDDASGEIVEHIWDEPGIYPIALIVDAREEPRWSEPARTIVEIGNHDPVADPNGPYETTPCTAVALCGSDSYDPDEPVGDQIVSYEWDLDNDGEYDDASGECVSFHSAAEGVYTVRLKVTDTFGATGTAWTTVTVAEVAVLEVMIDIKPGSDPNSINSMSKGLIPVAILTTPDFDATMVDWTTVRFGPNLASAAHDLSDPLTLADHQRDVDGDGDVDFVFHFPTQDTGIAPGDTEACLDGTTLGGTPIHGCDSVRTVGK